MVKEGGDEGGDEGGEEGRVTICSDIDIFYFEFYGEAEMFYSTRWY